MINSTLWRDNLDENGAAIRMRAGSRDDMMIALSLGLCKPVLRCRPAIALCHRDRAGQAAGPAMSAMPRKRRLAVKIAPVAMGQIQTWPCLTLKPIDSG
jgi:hypothetical protein